VAFFDYCTTTGHQDLLFINSCDWLAPVTTTAADQWRSTTPTGHPLTDFTAGSALDVSIITALGVATGTLTTVPHRSMLYKEPSVGIICFTTTGHGKFHEVDAGSGRSAVRRNDWSTCAAFFDYDNDGRTRPLRRQLHQVSREIDAEVGYKIDGRTRAYGQPMNFQGAFPYLYHNDRQRSFSPTSRRKAVCR